MLAMMVRAQLRSRWRGWFALGLLVGLMSGAVLGAAAGARRIESAYPRFLHQVRAFDAYIYLTQRPGVPDLQADHVLTQPQVVDSATLEGFAATEQDVAAIANLDGHLGTSIDRFKILAGRPPRPDRPEEAMVGFLTAERRHLHLGSTLMLHFVPTSADGTLGSPVGVAFRVVGIEAGPGEFPPVQGSSFLPVLLTPAFLRTPLGQAAHSLDALLVRLRRGSGDMAPFRQAVERRAGSTPVSVVPLAPNSAVVEGGFHLQALALWLLAGVAALVGLVVALQLVARQLGLSLSDGPTLRALGATAPQLWALGLAGAGVAAAVGAAAAGLVAFLLSALAPFGVARLADPRPGFSVDAFVLGLGAVATFGLVLALATLPAWVIAVRSARGATQDGAPGRRRSTVGSVLSRVGLPLTMALGTRLALEPGKGAPAVGVWSGIGAVAVGVGSLTAALTFAASTGHLLATPRLYGVTFDAQVLGNSEQGMAAAVNVVRSDPTVEAAAVVMIQVPLEVNGVATEGESVLPVQGAGNGSLWPGLVEGRAPEGLDEVVLGTETLRAAHARVGGNVALAVSNISPHARQVHVVGRAVMPTFSDREQRGRGVAMAGDEIAQLVPAPIRPHIPKPDHLLVRFVPGTDVARAMAQLQQRVAAAGAFTVDQPEQPTDLVNFGGVRALPLALAGLMAALAAMTLALLLTSAVRRSRRELVILKSIGFVPRQVAAVIRWQATTLSVVGGASGLLLGLAAGRLAWTLAAGDLGVVAAPRVPALIVTAAAGATLVAVSLSLAPAAHAARLPVAATLRDE